MPLKPYTCAADVLFAFVPSPSWPIVQAPRPNCPIRSSSQGYLYDAATSTTFDKTSNLHRIIALKGSAVTELSVTVITPSPNGCRQPSTPTHG